MNEFVGFDYFFESYFFWNQIVEKRINKTL